MGRSTAWCGTGWARVGRLARSSQADSAGSIPVTRSKSFTRSSPVCGQLGINRHRCMSVPGEVEKAKLALKSAALGYGLAMLAPLFVTIVGEWVK